MSTLEARTLTHDDFSKSNTMEVRLGNNYVVPIDKSDAKGLCIPYDKLRRLKINDKRAYDYVREKDRLSQVYATFAYPLLFVALVGGAIATNINDLDDRLSTITIASALVGFSLMGGSVGEYLRARKFKRALNQPPSRQDE